MKGWNMETVFEEIQEAPSGVSRAKFREDLRILVRDAEELLRATAGDATAKAKDARSRLLRTLEQAKATYHRLQDKTVAAAKATDKLIHAHPYRSLGIVLGTGLLVGVLVGRR